MFGKKLTGIFESVCRPFRRAEAKTFVRYSMENGDVNITPVQGRDAKALNIPGGAWSFFFFDRNIKPGEAPNDAELLRKSYNRSPTHFLADHILTQREFYNMTEEETRKITAIVNQSNNADTSIAIDGTTARFVNERFDHVIIVHRQTREQLWPPCKKPGQVPSTNPKP